MTPRAKLQEHVHALLAADQPDKAIAEKTGLTLSAVKACIRRLRKRHKVTTRIGLAHVVWNRGNGYPKIPRREREKVVQFSRELDVSCQ